MGEVTLKAKKDYRGYIAREPIPDGDFDKLPDGHPLEVTVRWEEPRREIKVGDWVRGTVAGIGGPASRVVYIEGAQAVVSLGKFFPCPLAVWGLKHLVVCAPPQEAE